MHTVFMVCDDRGACDACVAQSKGATGRYLVKLASRFIDILGSKQVTLRTDGELPIQNLARVVAKECAAAVII